jgi:hypothetical protein
LDRPVRRFGRQKCMSVRSPVEIALLVTAFIAGIIGAGIVDRLLLNAIGPPQTLAQGVFYTIVSIEGLGGLIAFWFLASRVEFMWRGYQVGFRQGRAYYEERVASRERRGLAFDWFPLTEGYRPRALVRLSPLGTWDLDAPVWARGRRDEIAGRITKDLSSYEGWPGLLMPDTPAINSTAEGNAARALIRAVLERWPEWAPFVISGAETGRTDRLLLSVPPPEHPSHRLEVVHDGDAFEIAYECDEPGLRAATRFGLADGVAAVFCVCEFLRELRDGEMVVLVQRVPLLTRWRRSDRARHSAQFRMCPVQFAIQAGASTGGAQNETQMWADLDGCRRLAVAGQQWGSDRGAVSAPRGGGALRPREWP